MSLLAASKVPAPQRLRLLDQPLTMRAAMKTTISFVLTMALLWHDASASAQQIPAGMEHCEHSPMLACPTPSGSLPGEGIPYLCKLLVDAGAVSRERCPDFVAERSCPELLDVQVRARPYEGTCYGVLVTNCCPEDVKVDVTLDPVIRDDQEPTQMQIYPGGDQLPERVPPERV
jgi:hypothetical protein